MDRLIGSLVALNRYSAQSKPLPQLSAVFTQQSGRLELAVRTDRTPQRVLAWSATSMTRDFHKARWRSHGCSGTGSSYECGERARSDAYTALYAEAVFQDPDSPPFSLSTTVTIGGGPPADHRSTRLAPEQAHASR